MEIKDLRLENAQMITGEQYRISHKQHGDVGVWKLLVILIQDKRITMRFTRPDESKNRWGTSEDCMDLQPDEISCMRDIRTEEN